jgi:hypothetical protein
VLAGVGTAIDSTDACVSEWEGTGLADDAAEDLEERNGATAPELGGAPPPGVVEAVPSAPAAARPTGLMFRLGAATRRYGDGAALAAIAILYLFWPNNLAPDRKWYGGADDVVFVVLLAFLARRVIRRSPVLLDLPGAISRAVRRKFNIRR